MPHYPVHCSHAGCTHPAVFKVAARWSDGITHELKTYALCCVDCLRDEFRRSCERQRACRQTRGETLGTPEIFELARGARDANLVRREDLERGDAT